MLGRKSFSAILGTAAAWAASVALQMSSAGCGATACFVWSEADGPCPSPTAASSFFGDEACGSNVSHVDGEGSFNGQLCCYPVTNIGNSDFAVECSVGAGGFGQGGFGDGGFGEGGFGVGGSVGGSGTGGGPCVRCSEAFLEGVLDDTFVCSSSAMLLDTLAQCLCQGACVPTCADNICGGFPISDDCNTCAQDFSTNGCGLELNDCSTDF